MATGTVHEWQVESRGILSSGLIRQQHQPDDHFRISPNSYVGGTMFHGKSRAGRVYVLFGRCEFLIDDCHWNLVAPCYADLPAGEFTYSDPDECDVLLVRVWPLPGDFRLHHQEQGKCTEQSDQSNGLRATEDTENPR